MKRVKRKNSILFVFLVSGLGLLNVACSKVEKETDKKVKVEKEKVINYYPDKVDFAGEQAPLKIEDVKERFDRELSLIHI